MNGAFSALDALLRAAILLLMLAVAIAIFGWF